MSRLSDGALEHLRRVADLPELSETRYEIVEELARGGMGTVYLARDRELERHVALKVLSATELGEEGRARLVREARIIAQLEHPGIVPVHDVGTLVDGTVFYTMKRVEGERLDEHVSTRRSLPERLRIFERICEAVSFAHAHAVIHRDLKPSNVMVGPFGEVLVMDWGVAKILDDTSGDARPVPVQSSVDVHEAETRAGPPNPHAPGSTVPGMVLGTPGYMPPEQAEGKLDLVDGRADVYALGVILNELIQTADHAAPRQLRAICSKAAAEERDARYRSVAELAADVSSFQNGERITAYREGPFEAAGRLFRRYRAPILLIAAYLVVRSLILIFAGT